MSNQNQNQMQAFPPQHQNQQPGIESEMNPRPQFENMGQVGSGKLKDKVAIITGGDSGIGRAVSVAYAKEGANVVIVYLNEHSDAEETKNLVEEKGGKCVTIAGDIGNETFCQNVITETINQFGKLDILVNNAAEQHVQNDFEAITPEQLQKTFQTNVFSFFYLTRLAMPHLKQGSSIINTTSITAYKGNKQLIDYSATKGAIVSFTRSLSTSLSTKGIRVNGVAPGPVWTPLIPATFPPDQVATFGTSTPMKRAGQPYEIASAYVYLASDESSYMTGQVLHLNGGEIVNG